MSTALRTQNSLTDQLDLARTLVESGLLPVHIKTPGQALAIILAGQELGMQPMMAFRSLQIVKGKISEAADSLLGRFKNAGGRATFERLDATGATLTLTHPNGDSHTESFTMADAVAAGLTGNSTWKQYPKAMLRSRVITSGLKSLGWTGAAGVYAPEEMATFAEGVIVETPEAEAPTIAALPEQSDSSLVAQVVALASHPAVVANDLLSKRTAEVVKAGDRATLEKALAHLTKVTLAA